MYIQPPHMYVPQSPSPYAYATSPYPLPLAPQPLYTCTSQQPASSCQALSPNTITSSQPSQDNLSQSSQPLPIIFKSKAGLLAPLSEDEIPTNLSSPNEVIQRYQHRLLFRGKIGELAVKLAKESYFGEKVMKCCTVMGHRELPGLPQKTLNNLKQFIFQLNIFRDCWADPATYEAHWAKCVKAINHSCKSLRSHAQ